MIVNENKMGKRCCIGAALFVAWLIVLPLQAGLHTDVTRILRSQGKVTYGVHVVDAESGKVLFAHNANTPMKPASNMKILTTAVALKQLGPGFEFVTRVGMVGQSLVVVGSGDPLLGDSVIDEALGRKSGWVFSDIAERLTRMEVKQIKGIVVDSTVFDDQRAHPSWPVNDLNRWFAAEVCGINYNRNCVNMTFTKKGGHVAVAVEPKTGFLTLDNQTVAISSGKEAVGSWRKPGQPNHLALKGKVKKEQGPIQVAIEKPAAFFGFLLAEALSRQGIQVEGQLLEVAFRDLDAFQPVAEYRTTLVQCLHRCNKDSLNLAAEALLKTVAAQAMEGGCNGSWPVGQQVFTAYLASLGIPAEEFVVDDASGLSHRNRISPRAFTRVLQDMYRSEQWSLYKESLAIAGVDGTIKKYAAFKQDPYRGRILGKTGYINGAKS
ncbi:D-alanyl-D-alanine carboxypeptidase/D-alanyl-D-alanine-endopeptidase, partial [Planctomycetota bacterium]